MNDLLIASVACMHLHPAEWTAPTPRQRPCAGCTELAEKIGDALTVQQARDLAVTFGASA